MRIAAVSNDGVTISPHFGRATMYVVIQIEGGRVVAKESRPKWGHQQCHATSDQCDAGTTAEPHGFDADARLKHAQMALPLTDCQVVLLGGAGYGAYESLRAAGLLPVLTDIEDINEAVHAYVEGRLISRPERLH